MAVGFGGGAGVPRREVTKRTERSRPLKGTVLLVPQHSPTALTGIVVFSPSKSLRRWRGEKCPTGGKSPAKLHQ